MFVSLFMFVDVMPTKSTRTASQRSAQRDGLRSHQCSISHSMSLAAHRGQEKTALYAAHQTRKVQQEACDDMLSLTGWTAVSSTDGAITSKIP